MRELHEAPRRGETHVRASAAAKQCMAAGDQREPSHVRAAAPLRNRIWKKVRVIAALPLLITLALACTATASFHRGAGSDKDKLTEESKMQLLRGVIAEVGLARIALPRSDKGVQLTADGRILNDRYLKQAVLNMGPAIRVGDRLEVTQMKFEGSRIVLDLNGGLGQKKKWYEHLEIGMGGTMSPVTRSGLRPQGSQIVLHFKGGVPNLTVPQLKQLLSPIIEWNVRRGSRVVASNLPPRLQKAIHDHEVLVGMSRDMVIAAKGRTSNKIRERDAKSGDDYEDWVYGQPPTATFVRIEGDHVVRVTECKADGTTLVKTQPEVVIEPQRTTTVASAQTGQTGQDDQNRPTLRRPGETGPNYGKSAPGPVYVPGGPTPAPGQTGPQPLPGPGEPGGPTATPPPPGQPAPPGQ